MKLITRLQLQLCKHDTKLHTDGLRKTNTQSLLQQIFTPSGY